MEEIYARLEILLGKMKMVGYMPNMSFSLCDIENEQKESHLLYHNEKLSIVFCLINTPIGTHI